MIPADVLAKVDPGESDKNAKSDHSLNNFQLKRAEFSVADAVRRNLKAVFQECNQPAHNDHGYEWRLFVLQVTVPSYRHEYVGADQKEDRFHSPSILTRG